MDINEVGQQFVNTRFLRVEETAAILGISAATVRRWCADGRLDGVSLPGHRSGLRVRAGSIMAIVQGRARGQ